MMMSRIILFQSSSCVLVFLLCLSHECIAGRHLSTTMDDHEYDKAKLLNHSTIKGFETSSLLTVPDDDLNLEGTAKVIKNQTNTTFDINDKETSEYWGSKNKKEKIKYRKVKKFKQAVVHRRQQQQRKHHPTSNTFKVPPKNKQVRQQPGFNLDYSPPKTHPPSHN